MPKRSGLRVLVVGSGGREHALAWKLSRSPLVGEVLVAPGNGGIASEPRCRNLAIEVTNQAGLIEAALANHVDLTVIGPEGPLSAGIVDAFEAAGLVAFGPSAAAARLEGSKSFAKDFMARHGIPTATSAAFHDLDKALTYLHALDAIPVVKASGLAGGKGVIVAETWAEAEAAVRAMLGPLRAYGAAGDEVLLEERLLGPEVSVLAFCDGHDVAVMPAAQDHKRLLDGDRGPNTGGMGAVIPSPWVDDALIADIVAGVFRPTLDGLAAEGTPFVGVLYAGLILTADGPRVLEFNCRFGDPEAQVILPLLETDLVEIINACLAGRLASIPVMWSRAAAATIVIAAAGYPDAPVLGAQIHGVLDATGDGCVVFQAGTKKLRGGRLVVDGGRVLAVSAVADRLEWARYYAYEAATRITFEGAQRRSDIGQAALRPVPDAYAAAGVDIEAANQAVAAFKDAVARTFTPRVLTGVGAFGGLFSIESLVGQPVLCASTDGVGTKVKLAAEWGRWRGIGHDLVNHCVNDILVQGARPLFFLDYVAMSNLKPDVVADVVTGIAEACELVGAALLGGETAEMPGVYTEGAIDVAGTIVGLVDRSAILPRLGKMAPGDVLIGIPSDGLHTNGFSLARRLVEGRCDEALADALLAPHRCYLEEVMACLDAGLDIWGLAHLTGGGWLDNIPRVLPPELVARIRLGSWDVPELFHHLVDWGRLSTQEAYRTFNMGIGLVAIVAPSAVDAMLSLVPDAVVVGELEARQRGDGPQVVLA